MSAHPIPASALDTDIAVLGRKGGGKTITAKGIAERLIKLKRRVLILDPLGGWYGLRAAADGKSPGLPVTIFGGEHADIDLDPAAAVPIADVIARENMPAVVDLSDLSKTMQQRFLLNFLRELRRKNREALTLILEEADVFAPQNPMGDDSKELHGEIDWIARRGRARGFRLITICQRPARLSKDVLTQAATLIAHKLPSPQDRDAVKAWVEGNGDREKSREVFDTLATLATGEAWLWITDPPPGSLKRVRFPMIETFDTTATPKAGETKREPKTLAQVDVSAIRSALEKAKAPKFTVRGAPGSIGKPPQIDEHRIRTEAHAIGHKQGFEAGVAQQKTAVDRVTKEAVRFLKTLHGKLKPVVDALEQAIDAVVLPEAAGKPVSELKAAIGGTVAAVDAALTQIAEGKPSRTRAVRAALQEYSAAHGDVGKGEQAVLNALALWRSLGFDPVERKRVCIVAGYSPKASTFSVYVSKLAKAGLLEVTSGKLALTTEGIRQASVPDAKPIDLARSILDGRAVEVFDIVTRAYPNAVDRDAIFDGMDLSRTASTASVYISKVTSVGLAESAGRGSLRAPDWLFA